jgi:hypothetical protein
MDATAGEPPVQVIGAISKIAKDDRAQPRVVPAHSFSREQELRGIEVISVDRQ